MPIKWSRFKGALGPSRYCLGVIISVAGNKRGVDDER
jgi:hypothetical protein